MAPVISIMMAEKLVFAIARRHTTCLPDLVRCRGQSALEQNRYRFLPMLWPTVSTHCSQHRHSAGGMARDAIFSAEVAAPPWPVSGHPGASAQLLLERGAGGGDNTWAVTCFVSVELGNLRQADAIDL
jgi:hypothetical protein